MLKIAKMYIFTNYTKIFVCHTKTSQGRRERGWGGGQGVGRQPFPPPFPGANIFFPRKIGERKTFTCEKHMRLEFIY